MEILESLSNWLSSKDLSQKDEEIPAAPSQSILTSILSSVDNVKRVSRKNLTDLVSDPENALEKTADNMDKEVLSKKNLQDPAQWLAPGSGAIVGAFRPVESKLLPSSLYKLRALLNKDVGKEDLILSKISDKELSKYGTTDFLLDKYLPSTITNYLSNISPHELKLEKFLRTTTMGYLRLNAEDLAQAAKDKSANPPFMRIQENLLRDLKIHNGNEFSEELDIRAYRDQIKDNLPLYVFNSHWAGSKWDGDIPKAIDTLKSLISKSSYTPEQLSKKSLQQLLGIAKEVEKQAKADSEAILKYTKERTASLKETQGLPNDLVELRDKRDFGAETYFLKHCVGAGAADEITGEFLPKWHPVTGEDLIKGNKFRNSADIYYGLMKNGNARYFSYRPAGIPKATIEINKRGKIQQLYGVNNTEVPTDIKEKIIKGLSSFLSDPHHDY